MNTENKNTEEAAMVDFNITNAAIAELKDKFKDVSAKGPDGYKAVVSAISEVKNIRVGVEKYRESKVNPLLKGQRLINAEAKRITAELVKIEDPLKALKKEADAEKLRIKEQKRQVEIDRVNNIRAIILDRLHINPLKVNESTIEDLKTQLEGIEAQEIDIGTYEEFVSDAEKEKAQSVELLTESIAQKEEYAKQRAILKQEQEDAEAKRVENERVAEEQAERQRKIDEENAETKRKLDAQLLAVEEAKQKVIDDAAALAETARVAEEERLAAIDAEEKRKEAEAKKVREEAAEAAAKIKREAAEEAAKIKREAAEKAAEEKRKEDEAKAAEVAEQKRIDNLTDAEFLLEFFDKITELGRPQIQNEEVNAEINKRYDALLSALSSSAELLNGDDIIMGVE